MNPLLSAYPQQFPRDTSKPWIMAVPVVSTVHIPASDRARLLDESADGDILATINGESGHIVILDDIDDDGGAYAWASYSPEFLTLLSAFRAKGYSYLRLDADGDVIDGWQTFD